MVVKVKYITPIVILLVVVISVIVAAEIQYRRLYSLYDTGYRLHNGEKIVFTMTIPSSNEERIVGVNVNNYDYMIVAYTHDLEHIIGVFRGQRSQNRSWWVPLNYIVSDVGRRHSCEIRMENNVIKFIIDGQMKASVRTNFNEVPVLAYNVNVQPPQPINPATQLTPIANVTNQASIVPVTIILLILSAVIILIIMAKRRRR